MYIVSALVIHTKHQQNMSHVIKGDNLSRRRWICTNKWLGATAISSRVKKRTDRLVLFVAWFLPMSRFAFLIFSGHRRIWDSQGVVSSFHVHDVRW